MTPLRSFGRVLERRCVHVVSRGGRRATAIVGALALGVTLGVPAVASGASAAAAPTQGSRAGVPSVVHRSAAPDAAKTGAAKRTSAKNTAAKNTAVKTTASEYTHARPAVVGGAAARPAVHPLVSCTDSWKTAASGPWNTPGNWTTGAVPTSTDNACITAPGTYTVSLIGSGSAGTLTLGGTSGAQTLDVLGTPGNNSSLTLSTATGSDIGTHGIFELDNTQSSGGTTGLEGGSGITLVNDGIFEVVNDSSNTNYIETNLTNDSSGKVSIAAADTRQDSGTLTANAGSFTVAATGNLAVSSLSKFTQSAGTLDDSGTLTLNNSTFTQSGGTESGGTVQLSNSSTLNDSAGVGSFDLIDAEILSGTIPSGQTVTVLAPPGHNATVTLASPGVTNDGTLISDAQPNGGITNIIGSPLNNNGTFETVKDGTNTDYIETNLTNTSVGHVSIAAPDTRQDEGTTTSTSGVFTVTATGDLALTSASVFAHKAGTLTDSGTLTVNASTFNQTAGNVATGTVQLSNSSTLNDAAGTGNFDLIDNANLSGSIPTGQTVTVLAPPATTQRPPSRATSPITARWPSTPSQAGASLSSTTGAPPRLS